MPTPETLVKSSIERSALSRRYSKDHASLRFNLNNPAFRLDAKTTKQGDELSVDLVCKNSKYSGDVEVLRNAMSKQLEEHGVDAEWKEFEKYDQTKIIAKKSFDISEGWEEAWPAQHDWLLDVLYRFQEVFGKLVEEQSSTV